MTTSNLPPLCYVTSRYAFCRLTCRSRAYRMPAITFSNHATSNRKGCSSVPCARGTRAAGEIEASAKFGPLVLRTLAKERSWILSAAPLPACNAIIIPSTTFYGTQGVVFRREAQRHDHREARSDCRSHVEFGRETGSHAWPR